MCVLYWHKWLLFLTQSLSTLSVLPEKHRNVESTSDDTQLFCKVVRSRLLISILFAKAKC